MDLEKTTIQELLKVEDFAERCRVARHYPLTMLFLADMCNDFVNFADKLPPILARDEEAYLECLAEIFVPGENKPAAEPAAVPAAKAEEQKEQKPAAPAAEPAPDAAKPAAKPAEGNRGAGRPPKAAVPIDDIPDFDKLSKKELRDFCVKNSVISRVKQDMGNSKHKSMLLWCKQHFSASAVAPAAEPAEAAAKPAEKAEEKPAAESPSPYEGLSAKELYCLCKERGLTVAEKQSAEIYKEALSLDDMAREAHEAKEAAEAQKAAEPEEKADVPDITAVPVPEADEEAEEFDDWDDAEPAAEPAKEQEAAGDDDDDDDDWDI